MDNSMLVLNVNQNVEFEFYLIFNYYRKLFIVLNTTLIFDCFSMYFGYPNSIFTHNPEFKLYNF